jgi:hypothetical protein
MLLPREIRKASKGTKINGVSEHSDISLIVKTFSLFIAKWDFHLKRVLKVRLDVLSTVTVKITIVF